MTAPPDPVVSAAIAERDHAARLYAEHQATCHGGPPAKAADLRAAAARIERDAPAFASRMRREADQMERPCAACASLAGHAERTARQAELLAPARTPEMF